MIELGCLYQKVPKESSWKLKSFEILYQTGLADMLSLPLPLIRKLELPSVMHNEEHRQETPGNGCTQVYNFHVYYSRHPGHSIRK
jgi:hypothetical protein